MACDACTGVDLDMERSPRHRHLWGRCAAPQDDWCDIPTCGVEYSDKVFAIEFGLFTLHEKKTRMSPLNLAWISLALTSSRENLKVDDVTRIYRQTRLISDVLQMRLLWRSVHGSFQNQSVYVFPVFHAALEESGSSAFSEASLTTLVFLWKCTRVVLSVSLQF